MALTVLLLSLVLYVAGTAEWLVPVVLGAGWEPAVPLVRVMCLVGVFHALANTIYWVMLAQGRTGLLFGSELGVRFSLSRSISLVASWAHRQAFHSESGDVFQENPKNLLTLGGRFRTDWGLVGSLYAFSRSEMWDDSVENPAGLLEPVLKEHMDQIMLVLARIGWRIPLSGLDLEMGAKLFLPVSFSPLRFRYREEGGGVTPGGIQYGGEELRRVVSGYLQGSF